MTRMGVPNKLRGEISEGRTRRPHAHPYERREKRGPELRSPSRDSGPEMSDRRMTLNPCTVAPSALEEHLAAVAVMDGGATLCWLEVEPPLARLVLDRGEKRNAVTQEMLSIMQAHLSGVGAASRSKALVLRGEGRALCAGEDVTGFNFPDAPAAKRSLEAPWFSSRS